MCELVREREKERVRMYECVFTKLCKRQVCERVFKRERERVNACLQARGPKRERVITCLRVYVCEREKEKLLQHRRGLEKDCC